MRTRTRWLAILLAVTLAPGCPPAEDDGEQGQNERSDSGNSRDTGNGDPLDLGRTDTAVRDTGSGTDVGVGRDNGTLTDTGTPIVEGDAVIGSVELFEINDRFPTVLAHLLGAEVNERTWEFGGVTVRNEGDLDIDVLVEVELRGYSTAAREIVTVGAGAQVEVSLTPTFDFERLYDVTSPVTANAEVRLTVDGELSDLETQRVTVEPLNRYHWYFPDESGRIDVRPYIAAFTTPDDSAIHTLLTEAAAFSSSGLMNGYSGDALDQARAIYQALHARGIVYTSVSGSFFDGAQYVRLPRQSLATGSANCIDGALVFASAFESLGMEPIIIFKTGHAYVAVRDARGSNTWIFIETTMVSSASFEDAAARAYQTYQDTRESDDRFLAIDIKALRGLGITPVNLPNGWTGPDLNELPGGEDAGSTGEDAGGGSDAGYYDAYDFGLDFDLGYDFYLDY